MSKTQEFPHKEWLIWFSMVDRCRNPKNRSYPHYGAKGVTVCDAWVNSFDAFYRDLGPRPTGVTKFYLDRINPLGNYCPENCRWADQLTHGSNKSNTTMVKVLELELSVAKWGEMLLGLSRTMQHRFLDMKMDPLKALLAPKRGKQRIERFSPELSKYSGIELLLELSRRGWEISHKDGVLSIAGTPDNPAFRFKESTRKKLEDL